MTELVTFDRPPVNEVVLGRAFLHRPDFFIPYYGVFWDRIRETFPLVEQATPIVDAQDMQVTDAFASFMPRVWFLSHDKTQMVQIQNGRLYFNWRKAADQSNDYIRFQEVRRGFDGAWRALSELVKEMTGAPLQSTRGELTYVNYLEMPGKTELEVAEKGLRDFAWDRSQRFLPTPTKLIRNMSFPIPNGGGELAVVLHSAKNNMTGGEAIKLELSAKGPASDDASFNEWATRAHDFLVQGFVDLTTDVLHEQWGLRKQ